MKISKEVMKNIAENLITHVAANPHIKKVWITPKGEWYFIPMKGTEEVSREDILGANPAVMAGITEAAQSNTGVELEVLTAENADLKKANEALVAERDAAVNDLEVERSQHSSTQTELGTAIAQLDAHTGAVKELQEKHDAEVTAHADTKAALESATAEMQAQDKKIASLQKK